MPIDARPTRTALAALACAFLASACGSSGGGTSTTSSTGGSGGGTSSTTSDTGGTGTGPTSTTTSGSTSTSSSTSTGSPTPNGNPDGSCSTGIPAEGQPVDTSKPTTVVGTGTAASCTFGALAAAVKAGGIITFACGPDPVTIAVTATLTPPATNAYANETPVQTVIDGGNRITLDGGGAVQILSWVHEGSWQKNEDTLTLQHLRLVNGKTTPKQAIPACPPAGGLSNAECSTGFDDGEGGALVMRDGNLRVIDCEFSNNQAALLGPDTGGGAIYMVGPKHPAYIVKSTFKGNKAANAGAIGMLWAPAFILDCLFDGNSAVGTGANNNDPSKCSCMNNGQNEIGSGGNGGAVYKDGGDGGNLTICGTQIRNSTANEFGSAVFLTANGSHAKLVLQDSLLKNNTSPVTVWNWCPGVSTDNPHQAGSTTGSPAPVDTTFCDAANACSTTCSS
jgi:hypothetical protein